MPKRDAANKRGTAKPLLQENQTQKRRERAQELRSSRRHGALLAKRKKQESSSTATVVKDPVGGTGAGKEAMPHNDEWSTERLEAAVQGVRDSPMDKVLPYLTDLRKLLSLEDSPVEEVVEKAGLAPRLIQLLGASANDEVQIEATW